MTSTNLSEELIQFINSSPTPFHCVRTVADLLDKNGFKELKYGQNLEIVEGINKQYTINGGAIFIAVFDKNNLQDGWKIIGAHTDSPNFRVKPKGSKEVFGNHSLLLEPYGSPILTSWFDRTLGLAGKVFYKDSDKIHEKLVNTINPVATIPSLAIHLTRGLNSSELNRQTDFNAVMDINLVDTIQSISDISLDQILGWDLMTYPFDSSKVYDSWIASPRLDNQASCFAATFALIQALKNEVSTPLALVFYDHEEIGSETKYGAGSDFLLTEIEKITLKSGLNHTQFIETKQKSLFLSADMAHATHPNYSYLHEPDHQILFGKGPVLKLDANQKYATDGFGEAFFNLVCAKAGINSQKFVKRADMAGGSTIGPISSTRTGISTFDIGAPMLAMHSAVEFMSQQDVKPYIKFMEAFLASVL